MNNSPQHPMGGSTLEVLNARALGESEDLGNRSVPGVPKSLTLQQFARLERAGYELSGQAQRVRQRLRDEAEHAKEVGALLKELAAVDAQEEADREARALARIVYSTASPTAADNALVIGDPATFVTTAGYSLAQWDLPDGRLFVFRDLALVHFLRADLAAQIIARGKRLPGLSFSRVPSDLMKAIVASGGFLRELGSGAPPQPGETRDPVIDYERVLKLAVIAINGCDDLGTLELWSKSAGANEATPYRALEAALAARIKSLTKQDTATKAKDKAKAKGKASTKSHAAAGDAAGAE